MSGIDIDKINKSEVLIQLYNNVYYGIRYYKGLQWRITILSIGMLGGIIGLTQSTVLAISSKTNIQLVFSLFAVAVSLSAIYFIHHTAKRLKRQRTLRRRIERIFGLFDKGIYENEAILNTEWKEQPLSYWQDRAYLICWWGSIFVTQIYTIVVIWT